MPQVKHAYWYTMLALVSVVAIFALAACGASAPTPTPLPTIPPTVTKEPPPPPTSTSALTNTPQPDATSTRVQPSATPAETNTPVPSPTATRRQVVAPPKPTSAGVLEFTLEFGQSAPRKGDDKVQMTVILHIKGGAPPFQVLEDNIPQDTSKTIDGLQYVRDWHDCKPADPHTITLVSGDGQQTSQAVMVPYTCQ